MRVLILDVRSLGEAFKPRSSNYEVGEPSSSSESYVSVSTAVSTFGVNKIVFRSQQIDIILLLYQVQ
jgi:hypothetical protein